MIDYSNLKPGDFDNWCPICGRGNFIAFGELEDEDYFEICYACGCVIASGEKCNELIKKTDWIQNEFFSDMLEAKILEYSHLFPVKGKVVIQNIIYHIFNNRLFINSFYGRDDEGEGLIDTMTVWRQLEGVYKKVNS